MEHSKKTKESVTKKIQKTARETEKLKQELEALKASGLQATETSVPGCSTSLQSQPARNLKGSEDVSKLLPKSKSADKPKAHSSCKAGLQQKEMEKELRKDKLKKLQQKASELLQKNLQTKRRCRSQSRDPQVVRSNSQKYSISSGGSKSTEAISKLGGDDVIAFKSAPPVKSVGVILNEDLTKRFKLPERNPNLLYVPSINYRCTQQSQSCNFINTLTRQLEYANVQKNPLSIDTEVQQMGSVELSSTGLGSGLADTCSRTSKNSSIMHSDKPLNLNAESVNVNLHDNSNKQPESMKNQSNQMPAGIINSSQSTEKAASSRSISGQSGYDLTSNPNLSGSEHRTLRTVDVSDLLEGLLTTNDETGNSLINQLQDARQLDLDTRTKASGSSNKSVNTGQSSNASSGPSSSRKRQDLMKNVTIRSSHVSKNLSTPHLKFENEFHLLNDVHESISRLSLIEQTYSSLETNPRRSKSLQRIDTEQDSGVTEHSKYAKDQEKVNSKESQQLFEFSETSIWQNLTHTSDSTFLSQSEMLDESCSEESSVTYKGVAGMTLKMWDRMIEEEDSRIVNLKKMLKIREQTLLDRARGELVYLEMQRKQLLETGKLAEASSIKKKQRGILLKQQQERLEMRRLKLVQAQNALNRKNLLKQERKEIKKELLANKTLSPLKRTSQIEKTVPVPLRAHAICSATKAQESLDEFVDEVDKEKSATDTLELPKGAIAKRSGIRSGTVDEIEKTLLLRERALAKRRKTVQELLQWRQRLLEEEKVIEKLEAKIATIVIQEDEYSSMAQEPHSEDSNKMVTSANYSLDFEVENDQLETKESVSRLIEDVIEVQDNIVNSEEESVNLNIKDPQQTQKHLLDISVITIESSESTDSSTEDESSIIIVSEVPHEEEKQCLESSVVEISTENSKSSEELEEALGGAALLDEALTEEAVPSSEVFTEEGGGSSKEDESTMRQCEEIVEETRSQQSFENKTDEEKAASLNSKVLAIKGRFSIATSAESFSSPSEEQSIISEETRSIAEIPSSSPPNTVEVQKNATKSENDPIELHSDEGEETYIRSEIEELHRKQLAIEQEIKLLKEQQQEEVATPLYLREIPNKPPPPYTPPSKAKTSKTPSSKNSIIPKTKEEVKQIVEYCVKIIHKPYLTGNLNNVAISDNTLNLIAENIDKSFYKLIFELCKEVAKDHYSQFAETAGPSWLIPERKPTLARTKPLDVEGLKTLIEERVFHLLGFSTLSYKNEIIPIKWPRRKLDQVDEVVLQEVRLEDATWTDLELDSALVKDRMVNEIVEMVLEDTALSLSRAMAKKWGARGTEQRNSN